MNTDDLIHDGKGQTYRIGAFLGRGLYAKSYLIGGEGQKEWVLKIPLSPADLPADNQALAKISRQILQEQWELLHKLKHPNLCSPVEQFLSDQGIYCLLYKRQGINLSSELRQRDFGIQELLEISLNITKGLRQLPSGLFPHGAIHPKNLFRSTRDSILFMDPLPKLAVEHYKAFKKTWNGFSFSPPELLLRNPEKSIVTDTYAIAMFLYVILLNPNYKQIQEIEARGLSHSGNGVLEKSIETLLKRDTSSNQYFHTSFVKQFSLFMKRALNPKTKPSPPYRFEKISEFQIRLEELQALLNPSIKKVHRVIFSMPNGRFSSRPDQHDFYTSEPVDFRCSITSNPAIEDIDARYISCGIKLFNVDNVEDLSSEEDFRKNSQKFRNYNCTKTELDRQHNNRFQFKIQLEDIPPGNYLLDLGFKIEGSLSPLRSQQAFFQVLPEPGYHPPSKEEDSSTEDENIPPLLKLVDEHISLDEHADDPSLGREDIEKKPEYAFSPEDFSEDAKETTTEIAPSLVFKGFSERKRTENKKPKIKLSNPDSYQSPIQVDPEDIEPPIPESISVPKIQRTTFEAAQDVQDVKPIKESSFQEGSIKKSPFYISITTLEEHSDESSEEAEHPEEISVEPEYTNEDFPPDPITDEIDDSIGVLVQRAIQWLREDSFRLGLAAMCVFIFLLLLIWLSLL